MTERPCAPSAEPTVTCPECGRSESDRSRPRPAGVLHWRRSVPVLLVLVLTVALAAWLAGTRRSLSIGSGSMSPRIVDPPVTPGDLGRLADDQIPVKSGPWLAARLVAGGPPPDMLPGRRALDIGWAPAVTRRAETRSRGWPATWWRHTRYLSYDDAVARIGFRPAATDPALPPIANPIQRPSDPLRIPPNPRWTWSHGTLVHRPPPEETGGVETLTTVELRGLAVPLALVLVAWWASRIVRAAGRRRGRRRDRRLSWAAVVLVGGAVALALAGMLHHETRGGMFARPEMRQRGTPPGAVYRAREGYARLPWSWAELDHVGSRPDDRRLAQAILDLVPAPSGGAGYLAVAGDAESVLDGATRTTFNSTVPVVSVLRAGYARRGDFGPPGRVSGGDGPSVRASQGRLWLVFPSEDPDEPTTIVLIEPGWIGVLVIAMTAAWLLGATGCRLVHASIVRRRRRERRCAACGYRLGPVRARIAGDPPPTPSLEGRGL